VCFSTLLKAEGYTVVSVLGGEKARDLITSSEEFDLMISDIRMSPINASNCLSSREPTPSMSVIMLTAYDRWKPPLTALETRRL